MATQQNVTPRQLELARKALWHQDGDALRTADSIRTWLNDAGLVPLYPHAQFATPAPSFAEAVLGRPQNNWVPGTKKAAGTTAFDESGESSYAVGDLDDADLEDDEDESSDDEDFESDEEDDFDDEDGDSDETGEEPSGEEAEDNGSDDEDGIEDEDGDLEGSETDGAEEDDSDDDDSDEDDEPATAEGDEAMLAGDGNIPSDPETMLSNDDEIAEDEGDEIAEDDHILAAAEEAAPEAEPVSGFTPEERETVHRALARLVEDGSAVPLNLLGSTTGEPDFLVPASAFSFVYTLRGDKNWKAEPATTGAMRVSPLAVKVYGLLKEKGAQAPHELTSDLGQGITDSATLRALAELWAIQRVIPLPDADGAPAKWELMTGRFVRHLKAGANAGQPTALSALLSLYLSQTVAATSDEMEIFLSPLAARSRVREVVNGLSATRQLEPLVVEGKTLLHIAGALPDLPGDDTVSQPRMAQRSRYEMDDRRATMDERAAQGDEPRSERTSRPGAYPVRKPAGARDGARTSDRGGRPGFGGGRPAFNRGDRPSGGARPAFNRGDRPSGGARPAFGSRPAFGADRERRPLPVRKATARVRKVATIVRLSPARGMTNAQPAPHVQKANAARSPRAKAATASPSPHAAIARSLHAAMASVAPSPRVTAEIASRSHRVATVRSHLVATASAVPSPHAKAEIASRSHPVVTVRSLLVQTASVARSPHAKAATASPSLPAATVRSHHAATANAVRSPHARAEIASRSHPAATARSHHAAMASVVRSPHVKAVTACPSHPRGDRPFTPRGDGERRPFTPASTAGDRKPFAPRGDRPFTPRADGERRPFTPREGGDRKPFAPRSDRPFTPSWRRRTPWLRPPARRLRPSQPRQLLRCPRRGTPRLQVGRSLRRPRRVEVWRQRLRQRPWRQAGRLRQARWTSRVPWPRLRSRSRRRPQAQV